MHLIFILFSYVIDVGTRSHPSIGIVILPPYSLSSLTPGCGGGDGCKGPAYSLKIYLRKIISYVIFVQKKIKNVSNREHAHRSRMLTIRNIFIVIVLPCIKMCMQNKTKAEASNHVLKKWYNYLAIPKELSCHT